jgi:ubiquitin carboxyl-terminal hydrolase 14
LRRLWHAAIITHKGAAADSGHYIAFVARRALTNNEEDQDWVKFDDDKVSVFPVEKLTTLDGGGEDSSAYVLLYKSKDL